MYGAKGQVPPTDVLSACNDQDNPATEAYIEGSIKITYSQGTLPMNMNAVADMPLRSIDPNVERDPGAIYALDQNGSWNCPIINQDPGAGGFTLQPGQTATFPWWIIIQGELTNASPTITPDRAAVLSLDLPIISDQTTTGGSMSGPQVATCSDHNTYFLPFAQLPLASEGCTKSS